MLSRTGTLAVLALAGWALSQTAAVAQITPGAVRATLALTVNWGKRMPQSSSKKVDQAPAATTTAADQPTSVMRR